MDKNFEPLIPHDAKYSIPATLPVIQAPASIRIYSQTYRKHANPSNELIVETELFPYRHVSWSYSDVNIETSIYFTAFPRDFLLSSLYRNDVNYQK